MKMKLLDDCASVQRAIERDGFAWLPRARWHTGAAIASAWRDLRETWHDLEPDRYLSNQAKFRRRRYGRFYWAPATEMLVSLPNEPYFQSTDENAYAGGIQRTFAELRSATIANPFLQNLVRTTFACLPLREPKIANNWEVRVHQIRIVASPEAPGHPSPEGIHQDGTDFLTLHLVSRENVDGGQTTIYDLERRPIGQYTMLEELDSFIIQDPRVMHGVTPVHSADGKNSAVRDLLGIDFIYSPSLSHPG